MPRATSSRNTALQPTSSSPPSAPGPSSAPRPRQTTVFTSAMSTLLAGWTAAKVAAFLPTTFALLTRDGKMSTDALAWLPFLLNMLAVVAIGAPVSLAPLLTLIRAVPPWRRTGEPTGDDGGSD